MAKEFKRKYPKTLAFRLKAHAKVASKFIGEDEEVKYVFVAQKNFKSYEIFNTNIVVLTDKRLIVATKRLVFGYFYRVITPDMFNDLTIKTNIIWGKVIIDTIKEKTLFTDLNFNLPPNGIVGVIGPNGAGKTTLFRLIMGLEQADAGTFDVGETVKLSYVDQQHKDIEPEKSVYQVVSGGNEAIRMGGHDINVRAYLSRFNFNGADQEKKCGVLSGGERNRLHLAMALKQEGNVLLLDEPTNDIDVNTLRALEEGLDAFAGCAVVISHDRWFLDRICTHILAFEGDGEVFFFEGSYTDYEANKAKRLGLEEPKRIRYRKLMED